MKRQFLLFLLLTCLSSSWALAQITTERIKPRFQVRQLGFGIDVAFHGDSLLIGVLNYLGKGAIEIYTRDQGEWEYIDSIEQANLVESIGFGASFELFNDQLFVRTEQGIHVLEYISGQWTELQLLSIPDHIDLSVNIDLNASMLVSENYLFFQMIQHTPRFPDGALLSFKKSNSRWEFEQVIHPQPGLGDSFGWPVCLSGNSLIVGASRDPVIGAHSGSVYVYDLKDNQWTQSQKLIPGDAEFADQFGRGLACFDDRIVVHSSSRKKTYNFEKANNTWSEADTLDIPVNNRSLDPIHFIGEKLFVSGNETQISDQGHKQSINPIWSYRWKGGSWILEQSISISSFVEPWAGNDGEFGLAIAMNNKYFVASAPFWTQRTADGNEFDEIGEVFVFPLDEVFVSIDRFSELDFSSSDVSLFPNPATHSLNINIKAPTQESSILRIYDVLGRQVLIANIPANSYSYTAKIDALPAGHYAAHLCRASAGCSTSTFIKLGH